MIRYTIAIAGLLILRTKHLLACSGKSTAPTWETTVKSLDPLDASKEIRYVNLTLIKDHLDRNVNISWGGWVPPEKIANEWREWLQAWQKDNNNTDTIDENMSPQAKQKLISDREASGWPNSWLDLGTGQGPVPPPPWSYVPKNTGKPRKCLRSPRYGKCHTPVKRWGYNPYVDECQEFLYSGCGGNNNNFLTKEKCEIECALPPPSGCDSDSHISVDDLTIG